MKILLTAASIALMTGSAFAADAPSPVASNFNWSGGYLGLQTGYGWGKSRAEFSGGGQAVDPDGLLGGVYAGYNYQLQNSVVLGIDADIAYSAADGEDIFINDLGVPFPDAPATAKLKWSGAIRGRAGVAIDRFLPYLSGGVAFARYRHTETNSAGSTSYSDTFTGWTVGAGLDYAITDNLIARAEYRYTDFGSQSYPTGEPISAHSLDLTTNDVRLGIAYKF